MSQSPNPGTGQTHEAALTRDLSEFLLELSIGVHRHAMYPAGHPSLHPAAENIIGRLGDLFLSRGSLSIGVARDQLVIEGVATDSKHPVLSDLARRLHDHQLGAVSFAKGATIREVEGLLTTLAQDAGREGEPLGLRSREAIPSWEHIRLYPLGYDKLELKGGSVGDESAPPERGTQLWLGLARAALATDEPLEAEAVPDPGTIARSIGAHRREAAYDQVIVGYLLQLADELKDGQAGETEAVKKRVSGLIRELDASTLERLVEMGGSASQRRKFVLDANQSLSVDAVVKILGAAANASGQSVSTSLTRLLAKLSAHAELGPKALRDQADTALRDNVEELLKDWELEDPNPGAYTLVLDAMAKAAPVFHAESGEEGEAPGARRLVQMSLEVDTWGPTVIKAVWDLMDQGAVSFLLELADLAPRGSRAAAELRRFVVSPSQLHRLLSGSDVDERVLRVIVDRMGSGAIPTLLDVLMESESRSVRRKVFDVLAGMGEEVGPAIMTHLSDSRWYVLRNMLALVQRLASTPPGFNPAPFLEHDDPRVRREAFPLAVRDRSLRERSLAVGLVDSDERLLRMALLELQAGIPETLVPVLVNRVVGSGRSPDMRALGVRALRSSHSALALEALLRVCTSGKTILGKWRLAHPSLEVVAAIQVLAERWRGDPRADEVLSAAQKSKDPAVARAAGFGGERA